jgi:DNA-binding Lrp family transcriptional regulator
VTEHEEVEPIALDETDRAVLNRIQSEFPIDPRPYQVLGSQLGLTEDEAWRRVRNLRSSGVIRRVGGNFSSSRVGYASTLCAARVPEDRFDRFVEVVNRNEGVTHNYRRDHDLNVWFTFIAPTMADIEAALADITRETGVTEIYNLPALRTFKIKVDFRFEE